MAEMHNHSGTITASAERSRDDVVLSVPLVTGSGTPHDVRS